MQAPSETIGGILEIRRGRPRRQLLAWHLPGILLAFPIYFLSTLRPGTPLPLPSCRFRAVTGIPCPTCGFTRSFLSMGRGEWRHAWINSPFACALYLAVLLFLAVNITALALGVQILPGKIFRRRRRGFRHSIGAHNKKAVTSQDCIIFVHHAAKPRRIPALDLSS